jgi:hypothetical protein
VTFGTNAALLSDGPPGTALDAAQTPARALTVLIAVPTIEAGAALGQADDPLPGQSDDFGDGVIQLLWAADTAEVDLGVALDARQHEQKHGLDVNGDWLATRGRSAGTHGDLLNGLSPSGDGRV